MISSCWRQESVFRRVRRVSESGLCRVTIFIHSMSWRWRLLQMQTSISHEQRKIKNPVRNIRLRNCLTTLLSGKDDTWPVWRSFQFHETVIVCAMMSTPSRTHKIRTDFFNWTRNPHTSFLTLHLLLRTICRSFLHHLPGAKTGLCPRKDLGRLLLRFFLKVDALLAEFYGRYAQMCHL